jgi:hypothetical protein
MNLAPRWGAIQVPTNNRRKRNMAKYGYMCFITFTHDYLTSSNMPTWREEPTKLAEKHGFKLHFAGSPWGTNDHAVMVCSSDKELSDWSGFIGEWLRDGKVATTRTILVNIPD